MEPVKKLALSVGRLTIFFAVAGAIAGFISGLMTSADIKLNIVAPLIALILFYASYKLAAHEKIKNKFLMTPVEESREGKKVSVAMTGFWPHFIMWLIFWVLIYTLLVVK
ncbi:MAG: hypothetical protein QMD95_02270 [Candidatus Hodarchaeaceae archaeon]|nr:hypothetical protein [Candidatus Hodarchaeaceae archaeon]